MPREYIYEVSRLRALEGGLLTTRRLFEAAEAENEEEAMQIFKEAGYDTGLELDKMLAKRKNELLSELDFDENICPEIGVVLTVNDIYNIKTALKGLISGQKPDRLYAFPTSLDLSCLFDDIRDGNTDRLPLKYAETAKKGYDIILETADGKALEQFLDRAALGLLREEAEKCDSKMLKEYVESFTAVCDFKIALRIAKCRLNEAEALKAVCGSDGLPASVIARAAGEGTEEVISLMEGSLLRDGAPLAKKGIRHFEKWANGMLLDIIKGAKLEAFGPDPLVAYFFACEAEIKAVRTVAVCKRAGIDPAGIKERLGELYV